MGKGYAGIEKGKINTADVSQLLHICSAGSAAVWIRDMGYYRKNSVRIGADALGVIRRIKGRR